MKNLFILLVTLVLLSSCSAYQDTLKSDDIKLKYTMADSLYNAGKYKKSLSLWEQIVPSYRGKPEAERVMFLFSDTYYQLQDYYLAGYQFERFVKAYPQSKKRTEAAFKSAKSYYNLSPNYNLDQADTDKAMEKLQGFINTYPDSENIEEANFMIQELRNKLEKKQYEISKGYNKIGASRGTFPNAIKAFDNFISEYPGSIYREDAYFWKLDSAYQLAIGSLERLKQERLQAAKAAYGLLIKHYPEGKHNKEAIAIIEDVNKRLEQNTNLNESK